ncbi:DinB family protein [Virgibacillus siamensis]|uniref:DinB family protein n=1 Tax=Virgibacillus siamensis TaxID=480071 RepID=A0ABN1GF65_9BACI
MNHLTKGLYGENAHVNTLTIFGGLGINQAGELVPNQHSIWQILNHMIYWQEYILRLLRKEETVPPKHASETWPTEVKPSAKRGWELTVNRFTDGLNEAVRLAENEHGNSNGQVEHLLSLISHNSYHSGQVVFVRRYLNQWPPPTGGDTW